MKYLRTFAAFSVLFCIFTVSSLMMWSTSSAAKTDSQSNEVSSSTVNLKTTTAGTIPAPKVVITGNQSGKNSGSSSNLETSNFIDMTRLVLETSRDQTSNLAIYIQHATTIIVVFFTLLGAVGAAFGLHKLNDVDDRAKIAILKFENDLATSKNCAAVLEGEFRQNIELANKDLRREINDQIELVVARVEIDQSMTSTGVDTRMLRNASNRIQTVLDRKEVSIKSRIRGLADVAFAKKRLGDHESAFRLIEEAANTAKVHEPDMYPLLAFNAACYASLLKDPSALEWLSQAIEKNAHYKSAAATDSDFTSIRDSKEFKELTA